MTLTGDSGLARSFRVILEMLAVGAICWTASTVTAQNTAIAVLTTEVKQLQESLSNFPQLSRDVSVVQTQMADHERRIQNLEAAKAPHS